MEHPPLSKSSRRIVQLAYEEADRFEHDYVGSEHLLIALLEEPSWVSLFLRSRKIRTDKVRSAVEFISGCGKKNLQLVSGRQTEDAARVLELASFIARQSTSQTIQPEHLLLALLNEPQILGGRVLQSLYPDLEALTEGVRQHLNETEALPDR